MKYTGCGVRENSLAPLKARSFSDAMIANAKKFNLEHCNNITNSAGRRGMGIYGCGGCGKTSYKWVLRRFAVYVRTGGHSGEMAAGRVNPIGWYVCTQQKSVKRL